MFNPNEMYKNSTFNRASIFWFFAQFLSSAFYIGDPTCCSYYKQMCLSIWELNGSIDRKTPARTYTWRYNQVNQKNYCQPSSFLAKQVFIWYYSAISTELNIYDSSGFETFMLSMCNNKDCIWWVFILSDFARCFHVFLEWIGKRRSYRMETRIFQLEFIFTINT